jgi:hypothetical protein
MLLIYRSEEQNRTARRGSGDGKTRRVGLSGAVASLVVAVPCVTRQVTGRRERAFGMICLRARRRRSGARLLA